MGGKLYKREEWHQIRDNELFVDSTDGFILDKRYTNYPNYAEYETQAHWYEIDEENCEAIRTTDRELIAKLEELRKQTLKTKNLYNATKS